MKLRWKTLIIIGITLFFLVVFLYATSSVVLISGFRNLEQQNTIKNVERANEALFNEISGLNTISRDYSGWDDTYIFIDDHNNNYRKVILENNLTFTDLKINVILLYNSSGGKAYGRAYDFLNETEIPVPSAFNKDLSPDNFLLRFNDLQSSHQGIIMLPEGPMLISSQPILTSERQGPIRGTLIFGRYLNEAQIQHLSFVTHLSIDIMPFDSQEMPEDFLSLRNALNKTSVVVLPLDEQSIAGYMILLDIYGNPALIMRVDLPRSIYSQGVESTRYLFFSLIATSLIFISISLWLLEKMVLKRLYKLNSDVLSIGKSKELKRRIKTEGDDELSDLGGSINRMLEALELAEEELRNHHDNLEEMVDMRTKELRTMNEQLQLEMAERKKAEGQLLNSLQEKEVLLREIHHRVKNNMQIVSSLLDHQTQYIKDKKVIDIFTESQNRISSMSLVHEKLYRSKDLAKIDFNEYIKDLVANIFQSYIAYADKITLNLNIEKIQLDIDHAIPCGLIINELVTNSIKYAFTSDNKGEINIAFHKTDDNMLDLVIGDNGIGLPKDMDFKKTDSLGLHLVTILAEKQLHGQINLDRKNGTEFQIRFRGIN